MESKLLTVTGAPCPERRPFTLSTRDRLVCDCLAADPLPAQGIRLRYETRTGRRLSIEAARDALERLRRAGLVTKHARRGHTLYSRKSAASLPVRGVEAPALS